MDESQTTLGLSPGLWLPIFVVAAAFVVFLGWYMLKSYRRQVVTGAYDALVGQEAKVTKVHPEYFTVSIHGEYWKAVWDSPQTQEKPRVGDKVVVKGQQGLTLQVQRRT